MSVYVLVEHIRLNRSKSCLIANYLDEQEGLLRRFFFDFFTATGEEILLTFTTGAANCLTDDLDEYTLLKTFCASTFLLRESALSKSCCCFSKNSRNNDLSLVDTAGTLLFHAMRMVAIS